MKWNKLTVRKLTIEEQEDCGCDGMWVGPTPEFYEEVLVTIPWSNGKFIKTYVDTWEEFDNGEGFGYTDNDVIYWMKIPQYNGELDD